MSPDMTDPYDPQAFHQQLVAHGLILPSPVKGGYGRGPVFEDVLERLDALVLRTAAPEQPQTMTFPPLIARKMLEQLGYLDNFPQLVGSVHSFFGNEAAARELSARVERGERWEDLLDITEVMLLPAACYPVYPLFSGLLPEGGRLVTVKNWCYRHEPSDEPTRLQSFRMRELIRVGAPEAVEAWRDAWLERSLALPRGLGLPAETDLASDPFFGRAGRMMATSQREQRLKFEILIPVISREQPTAVCSFNWHHEHFTALFGVHRADGQLAHTACLGFGLERFTLAMFKTHGFEPAHWPAAVRAQLWD